MPTPVTKPVEETVARLGLLLTQLPPVEMVDNVSVPPIQIEPVPVIPAGCGLTVIMMPEAQPVDNVYDILALPADIPLTTPVDAPTVAKPGPMLSQVPPDGVAANVVVAPTQTLADPVIADGVGLTVIIDVIKHPVGNVNGIVGLPADTPVTTPVVLTTVAWAVLLLLHVLVPLGLLNVVVRPTHTDPTPVIAAGSGLTVTGVVTKQPVGNVNVIVALPADTPLTTPVEEPTDAIAELLLLHAVVPDASLNVVVAPTQTVAVPVMDAGCGLTVIGLVIKQPVPSV